MAGTAASAQSGPGVGYDRAAVTQVICRQYAAAQKAMPYDTMYAQCMYARGYRVPGLSPSPDSLVIKAGCRVPRLIMVAPDRAVSKRRRAAQRCGPWYQLVGLAAFRAECPTSPAQRGFPESTHASASPRAMWWWATEGAPWFEDCLAIVPCDAPSKLFLERIAQFRVVAPCAGWNGVWSLVEK